MATKRKCLDLEAKIAIIRAVDGGQAKSNIAAENGIPPSSLSTILKNHDKVLRQWEENASCSRKKMRVSPFDALEEKLFAWFCELRTSYNMTINGLMEKADSLAKEMGITFSANPGWLSRFKARQGIIFKAACGESSAVNEDVVDAFKKDLPSLLAAYEPRDIYNVDETGLFFRMLPDKTFALKGESCHGGKKKKERVTVLLGANMDGSHKLKPLVIGKSKVPRCLKDIKMSSLPVTYTNSPNAWMDRAIWSEFLKSFNRKMGMERREVLLFVDNCSAHKTDIQLKNITIKFLPANTTSVIQPMDQGVIQSFKNHYRRRLVQTVINRIDAKQTNTISVKDAIDFTAAAWRQVTSATISDSFRKGGFVKEDNQPPSPSCEIIKDTSDPAFEEDYQRLCGHLESNVPLGDFCHADDHIPTTAPQSTPESPENPVQPAEESDNDDNDEEDAPPPIANVAECQQALRRVHDFFAARGAPDKLLSMCDSMEDHLLNDPSMKPKQMSLLNFFSKKINFNKVLVPKKKKMKILCFRSFIVTFIVTFI